jgi:uncharacterized protein (TIGR02145 family)
MKFKFKAIQLLMIGLFVGFTTSCNDKEKEDELTPTTIEECAFFTAKYSKAQVWEVEFDQEVGGSYGEDFEVGKTATINVVGPARTINSMNSESQPVNWGTASDRYLQFKIEEGGSYSEIIDDIKNEGTIHITPVLFEKNGSASEDYDSFLEPATVVARYADGFVVRFHCSEEIYFMYFAAKALTNPTTISFKPTQGMVNKLSELGNGKIETQLDKLNKILPTAGGVTTVVFKAGATYGSMTDLNGNTYKTITIGTQTWMAENLRTTKYRNGESISIVNLDSEWGRERTTGACCSYLNTTDKNRIATDGLLYNAYAVNDSRNIAPKGWHVPSAQEWDALVTYLGGADIAGDKMKEVGTLHWSETYSSVTNASGFSSVPTGGRDYEYQGNFYEQSNSAASYASSTNHPDYDSSIWMYSLYNSIGEVYKGSNNKAGAFAVRLIKD